MKDAIITFVWPAIAGLMAALLILDHWVLEEPLLAPHSKGNSSGYREAVASATPSVVNIYTAKLVSQGRTARLNDPLLRRFPEPSTRRQRVERSLGSGVIMTADGHIITNNHVIAEADAIQVLLADGRSANAAVVGTDPATDLAVLKINLPGLSPIELTDSDSISVGDVVLAIGNPYGFGHSVSQGIVSGLGRYGLQLSDYEDYIQTDASIHLGNSGGALIDNAGGLVGINTLIYTAGSGSEVSSGIGINLATPSNLASFVLEDMIRYGRVIRGWLGVSVELLLGRDETGRQAQFLVVSSLSEGGPAERAGIRLGDIIVSINGDPVTDGRVAMHRIARLRPGEQVAVGIKRGENAFEISAVVGTRELPS
ncbi:peptidase s1, chymotrypsin:pdz/dhr/glgf [Luminiphilus syltensis NOR5-1B]|uniref:Peptidase s1, chymotrypsin:pdz/dhr/glgf n=1 Tax=Luminiphilus syltensis NOR5-1B TaxID=565045 RepID=B8KR75_9GAMM|nr:trypsin-like peptidase domain-containing protein [Luminiphilus syltensis]EED34554.1 peptidase s1, chymotrypsin:pdz/dhr/glgf [Luminiphilus syltensis NOR5-1B]